MPASDGASQLQATSAKEASAKSGFRGNTVVRFENEKHDANQATVLMIRKAFEAAGLLFIDADVTAGAGVRWRKP